MPYAEKWKQIKAKYESTVKDKKPSEKWFGQFRKSTGIESACKELDAAIAKQSRADSEKALATLKKAGEAYLVTLDKIMETELPALKQIRTKGMRVGLDDMLLEAHNEIKGMDKGQWDVVLGPDIMSRVNALKFPKDAFVKSFATGAEFTTSYTTNAKSPALAQIQKDFAGKYQVCLTAHSMFNVNKGKMMDKSQILKVGKTTLEEMMYHSGRDGMLGLIRTWEAQQTKETNGQKPVLDKFLKSTSYQVLKSIGDALNQDAEKLNASIAKLQTIKL
jgi:hypothetical protein